MNCVVLVSVNRFICLLTVTFLFGISSVGAQFYRLAELKIAPYGKVEFYDNEGFTAIQIESAYINSINLQIQDTAFQLLKDAHGIDNLAIPYFSDSLVHRLNILNTSNREIFLRIHVVDGRFESETLPNANKRKTDCSKPSFISCDQWREGLPESTANPQFTTVEHVVIHHSASWNSLTNYTQLVRNIYLLHTNTNGWSDIGYNYLVAPNGVVYQGRDAAGFGEEDNVKGAHFCGKNSNTMGICLLGDFTDIIPTDSALDAVNQLTAWKVMKDGLDPNGVNFHPKGSSAGFDLPTIVGHRDGFKEGVTTSCQTECPGEAFYQIFNQFQLLVNERLDQCGYVYTEIHNAGNMAPCFELAVGNVGSILLNNCGLSDFQLQVISLDGRILDFKEIKEASQIHLDPQMVVCFYRISAQGFSQIFMIRP